MTRKPIVLVFAGPNGSGKSTVTSGIGIVGTYVNADDIKTRAGLTDLDAAREAEAVREHCLAHREDFTFETVLSTDRNIDLLSRAVEAGYEVRSVFVLTADSELNAFRVSSRVATGGHDVPPDKIRMRYHKSLANLPVLVALSTECTVFDNTLDTPQVIFHKSSGETAIFPNVMWDEETVEALVRAEPAHG
ncbi:MAG: zeta toxin family protein [Propionibacteriaceae bacterium]|nr:zeta toxin family protein [Propionibacteriaceae bacterium]